MILSSGELNTMYTVLAALLLALNLFSRWPWRTKMLATVVVSLSYIVMYMSFPPLLGWPSKDAMPRRFSILGVYMREPDQMSGEEGNVFFWVVDRDPQTAQPNVPRGYIVPYTPELHARVKQVGAKLKKNIPQVGEVQEADLGTHNVTKEQKEGGQKSVKPKFDYIFSDSAPEGPPPKTGEEQPASSNR
ncbi:MAG TPA: hypothetical protein VMH34_03130 [Gammaproteobacteria bacterium]|nr:hypothetical protein [Gammaproteobacteria bacterium]